MIIRNFRFLPERVPNPNPFVNHFVLKLKIDITTLINVEKIPDRKNLAKNMNRFISYVLLSI